MSDQINQSAKPWLEVESDEFYPSQGDISEMSR
jgi:hypothetical protein